MSELSAAIGKCPKFTIGGKEYNVQMISHNFMADFENSLYQRRLQQLQATRSALTLEHYERKLEEAMQDYENSEFSLHGKYGKAILNDMTKNKELSSRTLDGFVLITSLLLQCDENEASELLIKHPTEVVNMIKFISKISNPPEVKDKKKATRSR